MTGAHHVVVVGAGFGGLETVHRLAGAPVEITIVDRRNHHLFQPLLYQAATASLAPSEIAWPIRHLFRRRSDVTTLLASVESIDRAGARSFASMTARRFATTRSCWRRARGTPISVTTPGSRSRPASRRSRTRPPYGAASSSPSRRRSAQTTSEARGAVDLRHCRGRPDRRRTRRHDRRAGARDAARRLPPHRHTTGAHCADRSRTARPARFRRRPVKLRQGFAGAAGRRGRARDSRSRNAMPTASSSAGSGSLRRRSSGPPACSLRPPRNGSTRRRTRLDVSRPSPT